MYKEFRCPCGAAGLYSIEYRSVIEAYCSQLNDDLYFCPLESMAPDNRQEPCPYTGTCEYCAIVNTLEKSYGYFDWESVCGADEANNLADIYEDAYARHKEGMSEDEESVLRAQMEAIGDELEQLDFDFRRSFTFDTPYGNPEIQQKYYERLKEYQELRTLLLGW